MKAGRIVRITLVMISIALQVFAQTKKENNWPQWRGPLATGVSPTAEPPLTWSEQKNIRWKTAIPGRGHSTPIIWEDRLFLTTAVPYGEHRAPLPQTAPGAHDNLSVTQTHHFAALAVDRKSGKIVWQTTLKSDLPHEGGHKTASLASASPATDGKQLYVSFGSQGIYCLTLDGDLVWEKQLGQMATKHGHGEGSTPVLYKDILLVNWDHEDASFLVALDTKNGSERWRVDRDEVTSWSSPIVVEHKGNAQAIVSGTQRVRGYDIETGNVIWECGGLSHNIVASPVSADGMVFVASSYEKQAILAIKLDGAVGDITGTGNVVWRRTRGTPYVPSPLLYGEWIYFLRHYQGILTRLVAESGEEPFGPFRLDGIRNVYASPVGAANRVYITSRDGATLVMTHEAIPEFLTINHLDDTFNASAALSGKDLFMRGEQFLYCIGETAE